MWHPSYRGILYYSKRCSENHGGGRGIHGTARRTPAAGKGPDRQLGADALADHELLELALFYAIPRQDTNETAHRLLKRFRSLQGVLQATPEELEKEEGVGRSAALLLCLIGDISRRARH